MRTIWKDIFREIKNTRGKFISLLVIAALGTASVVGILASSINMRDIADKTYKEHSLFDIQIKSTTGFSEDDIAALLESPDVETVMPTYIYDAFVSVDGATAAVRTYALPDELNTVDLPQGRLPEAAGECVVEQGLLDNGSYQIGDTITLESGDNTAISDVYIQDAFTIVGIVSSPLYITSDRGKTSLGDGNINYYIYLHPDAYSLEVYTDVYLLMLGASEMYSQSDDYYSASAVWKSQVELIGDARVSEMNATLTDAQTEIDEGRAEYYEGLSEYEAETASARLELDDALSALNTAKTDLENGQATLNSQIVQGLNEIDAQEELLIAAQTELDINRTALDDAQFLLDAARQEVADGIAQLEVSANYDVSDEDFAQYNQLSQSIALLDSQQIELEAQRNALNSAQTELDFGFAQLVNARTALETERINAQAEINNGWAEYARGLEDYNAGLKEFESETADARLQLQDARTELEDAQQELIDAPEPEWYYFTRQDSGAFDSYYQDTFRLQKIGYVFPMVFFLVAVLVSLTTMSRMIEEHRTQIGVYKALGYRPAEIMRKYIVYAFGASTLGGFLGVVIGSKLFPIIISQAYGYMYDLPPVETPIPALLSVIAILAATASIVLVTLYTCTGAMKSVPAELMRPKAPSIGKRVFLERIPFLWKRLGFFGKVTARNIFRYKKRFIMTLVGVAGCSALLLTAFGLRDSVGSVSTLQYDDIILYDARAYLKDMTDETQQAELSRLSPEAHLFIREETADASGGSGTLSASIIVPESSESITQYVSLMDPNTGAALALDEGDVFVTEKLARVAGVSIGNDISLTVSSGATYTARVTGIAENYVQHFVYMAPDAYTELFGTEPQLNSILVITDDVTAFAEDALSNENVRAVIHTSDLLDTLGESTDALSIVTIVLLVLACALAFVVLFNLTNINISERVRELATIKVLGFQDNEVSTYVYRENGIVTALGIALGLVLGIFLDRFVLRSVEVDLLKFPLDIAPASFILSVVIAAVFAIFVNLVMTRRLTGINMVESLKNVE